MDYKEALSNLKKAKKKKLRAEKDLAAKKAGLAEARQEVPKLHEALTDRMAELEADSGKTTQEDVSEARRKWESGAEKIDEYKTKIKAGEKTIKLLEKKVVEAREEFKEPAYEHFKKIADPIIDEHLENIENLQESNQKIIDLNETLSASVLEPTVFLPPSLQLDYLKSPHLKPIPIKRYIKQAQEIKG